jgi:hypothetical protein
MNVHYQKNNVQSRTRLNEIALPFYPQIVVQGTWIAVKCMLTVRHALRDKSHARMMLSRPLQSGLGREDATNAILRGLITFRRQIECVAKELYSWHFVLRVAEFDTGLNGHV